MLSGILVSLAFSRKSLSYKDIQKTNTTLGSRANFAIASSFLMQLMLTAEGPETQEINDLVTRWRWAMRVGSGNSSNGLMSLGLLRLDGLLLENNGSGSNSNAVASSQQVMQAQEQLEDGQGHQRLAASGVGIMS